MKILDILGKGSVIGHNNVLCDDNKWMYRAMARGKNSALVVRTHKNMLLKASKQSMEI